MYTPYSSGLPSHTRASSVSTNANAPSSVLQSRINEKKLELESLKQLRDLSGGLADQMQQLEDKLATLSGGTEAVATVMGNWNTILRAIHLASTKIPSASKSESTDNGIALPQTLVRIPIEQAEAAQKQVENANATEGE